jgi:type I restriction enzyme M protein
MPNTSTKTSILIFQKLRKEEIPEDYPIFMAVAETCGHDRRGKALPEDDIKKVADEFKKWAKKHGFEFK